MNEPADSAATAQADLDSGIAHHQRGETAAAREKYQRVLEAYPDHADALHLCGITWYQDGVPNEAEACIRAALALRPDHRDYHSNLGLVLKSAGRYDEAVRAFHRALEIDERFVDCLNNLGGTHVAAGSPDEAEAAFRQLLAIEPDHPEGCNNLAVIVGSRGAEEEASALYEKALAARPGYVDARLNYGRMLARSERFDEAALHFGQVVDQGSADTEVLRELGDALQKSGRLDEAMAVCRRALDESPDDPENHVSIGSVLQRQHRDDEAELCYRRALELDPDNARANNNLGAILLGRNAIDDAMLHFDKAIRGDPEFVEAQFNKGTALQKSGRLAEAAGYFSMAIARNPRMPSAYRYLAEIYRVLGLRDSQVGVLREWLAVYPASPTAEHLLRAAEGGAAPRRASDEYMREEFDEFAETFDETLSGLEYSTPARIGDIVREIVARDGARLDILDAGCGTGLCAAHLAPVTRSLVGVDLSSKMIDKAAVRGGYDELAVGELVAWMQSAPARFDLIVSADTLVYFGELDNAFRAARTALKAGGWLVFSVERLPGGDDAGFRLNPSGRYAHDPDYVSSRLAAAGFDVERIDETTLRKEASVPVEGLVVAARAAGAGG